MNDRARHGELSLALDVVTLVGELSAAQEFYAKALDPSMTDRAGAIDVDMNGTGRFQLAPTSPGAAGPGAETETSQFPGYVVTYALAQPVDVQAVMDAARRAGAEVLKPAKKALFGSFSGSFRAPDGSVWKVAADSDKNTGPAAAAPRPTEISIILGVKDAKASRKFYQALGMTTDRDYGSKYIDFHPSDGAVRLCLMPRTALAKDVGIDNSGDGVSAMVLGHCAAGDDVDRLLTAAEFAGGRPVTPHGQTEQAGRSHFTDPDGVLWTLTS